MKKVGVIGGGISGLGAALELAKQPGINVTLYEKEDFLGGHASKSITINGLTLDLSFLLFNRVTCPHMTELFDSLDIDTDATDVSFSVSLDKGLGLEWGCHNGYRSLFAQKGNLPNLNFWKMLREINKFKDDVIIYLEEHESNKDTNHCETLGQFIKSRDYSELFQKAYLVPMCGAIWSCTPDRAMEFSAFSVLSFCHSHHLLQLSGHPQWLTARGGSHYFVKKLKEELETRGCQIKTSCEVLSVSTSDNGCVLSNSNGTEDVYDECVMAVPAPDVIKILGKEATYDEMRILGAFQYIYSDIFLHNDKSFMPQNPAAWSAWNFLGSAENEMLLTYWLNVLQNISKTSLPFLATVNPPHKPESVLLKWSTGHLLPSVAATKASLEFRILQGKRGIWFTEAYHGNGSHEQGLKAGLVTAHNVLGKSFTSLRNPKQFVPSWTETAARLFVIRFFKQFISAGSLTLLEEGGAILTFEGSDERCTWKSVVRVHNPRFYWKVATEADLGLADAFIHGDISVVDKNDGLVNFFKVMLANLYLYPPAAEVEKRRRGSEGGWRPIVSTAALASVKYLYQHVSRRNTLTQARQNIARHYDLSNEMFSLFLDESMTYSCPVFKSEDEELQTAQLRKIHLIIDKARVEKHHELLELGCGWGSIAVEVVKKTGCKYTGLTLAEEQWKYAEQRAKDAGLQDRMTFLHCDYRNLPSAYNRKYNRIIACGLLEHVGDEYYEDFFRQCESLLADDGVLVVQFISMPDERYAGHIRSSDFMREYIFPGGCLPSFSRITTAMAAGSRLCVEHAENIGVHYAQALVCWRKKFLSNQSKIRSLGFDEKFLRVWEYYFDYCAAGFITRAIGDYQIVFSRQGNLIAFKDPYASIPSAHSCS